jgi:hypothetical protein
MHTEMSITRWRRSSYSDASGGDCVEIGLGLPDAVPVRDSKVTNGPVVTFHHATFSAFVAFAREDRSI